MFRLKLIISVMIKWYDCTILLHKLSAGLILITCFQISTLFWYRSLPDVIAILAISIDLCLAFTLIGFYSIYNENKKMIVGYILYLMTFVLLSLILIFQCFSLNVTPLLNKDFEPLPVPLSEQSYINPFLNPLASIINIKKELNGLNIKLNITGSLPPLYRSYLFPTIYLRKLICISLIIPLNILIVSVTLTVCIISLIFNLKVRDYFGKKVYEHYSKYYEESQPKTVFQITQNKIENINNNYSHNNHTNNEAELNDSIDSFDEKEVKNSVKRVLFLGKSKPTIVHSFHLNHDQPPLPLDNSLPESPTIKLNF
ncbi:hypothetical protein K502DRAFT_177691 [Neoconidiobolus thromboides FSU 785]|nr:hypothetical protein K502DRAFT_177691 [Neoconidiobolus thromboides FSU 785]